VILEKHKYTGQPETLGRRETDASVDLK